MRTANAATRKNQAPHCRAGDEVGLDDQCAGGEAEGDLGGGEPGEEGAEGDGATDTGGAEPLGFLVPASGELEAEDGADEDDDLESEQDPNWAIGGEEGEGDEGEGVEEGGPGEDEGEGEEVLGEGLHGWFSGRVRGSIGSLGVEGAGLGGRKGPIPGAE